MVKKKLVSYPNIVKLRLSTICLLGPQFKSWQGLKSLVQRKLKKYKLAIILPNDFNPAIGVAFEVVINKYISCLIIDRIAQWLN